MATKTARSQTKKRVNKKKQLDFVGPFIRNKGQTCAAALDGKQKCSRRACCKGLCRTHYNAAAEGRPLRPLPPMPLV